jgi:malate dehydrogenase
MGIHVAVVGNGRIGRPTAYSLLTERLMDELSLVDIKPGLSWAFGEELKHAAASLGLNVEINSYEKDDGVSGADLVVVCPGKPRMPGVQQDRRDLATANAATIKQVAEEAVPRNPGAKWVVVSNPVDAMATLFKRLSRENFVIATGDYPDTLRFRTKLCMDLGVKVSEVEGFVAGEHGSAAYPLWSTTRIKGKTVDDYLTDSHKTLDRVDVVKYVRGISKQIVDVVGATEFGPAAGFRDVVRAILKDRRELMSVSNSMKFPELPEAVNVSVPTIVGSKIGPNIWDKLTQSEQADIKTAAKAIYGNYKLALESLNLT